MDNGPRPWNEPKIPMQQSKSQRQKIDEAIGTIKVSCVNFIVVMISWLCINDGYDILSMVCEASSFCIFLVQFTLLFSFSQQTKIFAQTMKEMPEWFVVLREFKNLRCGAFLFVAWWMGFGIGLIFAFLFWHLQVCLHSSVLNRLCVYAQVYCAV